MKVFNWIFSVFCILCLPVFGFHVGSILMCILGIASLPVKPIKEKWELLPKYKVLRPIIVGILFVVFCCMIPTGKKYADLETDLSTSSYEYYSELDSLGRCGVVYACIGTDLMPMEEREEIGSVNPTGWQMVKYDVVYGKYLYNICQDITMFIL